MLFRSLYTEYLAELKSVRRMERRQALNKMNEALALAQKEADAQKKGLSNCGS